MTHIEAQQLRRERARKMACLVLQGKTRRQVAALHGISRQRVQQLVREVANDLMARV